MFSHRTISLFSAAFFMLFFFIFISSGHEHIVKALKKRFIKHKIGEVESAIDAKCKKSISKTMIIYLFKPKGVCWKGFIWEKRFRRP